jgi:acetyl esterase/lipase
MVKTLMTIIVSLFIMIIAIGFASGWSGLGLMNLVDSLLSSGRAERVESGAPFGQDPRQKLDVWIPKSGAKEAPVVVFFYGGSWNSGNRENYAFAARAFAESGYVVVIPDYRLIPTHAFPAFLEDGAAAVAWTENNIARHGGDPEKIFVAGHSAGAHIGAMLSLNPSWLAKAKASRDVIKGFAGIAGPYDFLPLTNPAAIAAFGSLPDQKQSQPVTFANKDAPPMVLFAGNKDTLVKPNNATALAAAQKSAGASAEVIIYDGVDHQDSIMALAQPFRGKATVLSVTTAFFQTILDKP